MTRRIRGYASDEVESEISRKNAGDFGGDFGPLFQAPSVPVSTSEDAAIAIQPHLNRLRARVYEFIAQRREFGATCDEIEAGTSLRGNTIRPRLLELELVKRIVRTTRTRPTRSGRQALVWCAQNLQSSPSCENTITR